MLLPTFRILFSCSWAKCAERRWQYTSIYGVRAQRNFNFILLDFEGVLPSVWETLDVKLQESLLPSLFVRRFSCIYWLQGIKCWSQGDTRSRFLKFRQLFKRWSKTHTHTHTHTHTNYCNPTNLISSFCKENEARNCKVGFVSHLIYLHMKYKSNNAGCATFASV
jgi:hypothetical protein